MNTRNQPCNCGSGIKTKLCCGSEAKKTAERQEALRPAQYRQPSESANTGATATPEHHNGLTPERRRRQSPLAVLALLAVCSMSHR